MCLSCWGMHVVVKDANEDSGDQKQDCTSNTFSCYSATNINHIKSTLYYNYYNALDTKYNAITADSRCTHKALLITNEFVDMNSSHTAQKTLWLGCGRS